MADGKWITGLTPDMPSEEAARVVLAIRLSSVRHYLPLAAESASDDIEHVHQLRVATRRAGSAVWIFRNLLSNKARRGMKRALRSVRRAAGGARDWDVFLNTVTRENGPATSFLAGYALRERLSAQVELTAIATEQFPVIQEACLSIPTAFRVQAAQDRSLGDHASHVLGNLFKRFHAEVMSNPSRPEELHRLRITTKRLRYSIEVFAGCDSQLRETSYPAIQEAQEILGNVQDAAVATNRLEHIVSELGYLPADLEERVLPAITGLAETLRNKRESSIQRVREGIERWKMLFTNSHVLSQLGIARSLDSFAHDG